MTILLSYKPGPLGEAALARAIIEARTHDHRLVVLNVARGDAAIEDERMSDAQAAELTATLDAAGVAHDLERIVRPGDVADEVVHAAERLDVDMIVIGLRHRSAVGKFILGSDGQRILLHSHCPVLAIKLE